jgi:hypothetical protein
MGPPLGSFIFPARVIHSRRAIRVQCRRVMLQHKFKIGQRLFLVRALNAPDGPYVVVKRLPKREGEFEYQIKCVTESHECVVRESQLRTSPWRNAPVTL